MASWTQIRRAHYAWHSLSSITSSSLASIIFSSPRGTCLALAYRALTDNMSGKEGEREEHSRIIHGLFPPLWSLQLKLLPHTLINHYCDDGVALEEGDFLAVCVPVHYVNLEFARELRKGGGHKVSRSEGNGSHMQDKRDEKDVKRSGEYILHPRVGKRKRGREEK